MQIVHNALVTISGAYYPSGGVINGTQRINTNHVLPYWQQGNMEQFLAIEKKSVIRIKGNTVYVGRLPLHLGHFIMEGLPRLCDIASLNMPMIGYATTGFLPEGVVPIPRNEVFWIIQSLCDQAFYNISVNQTYEVETLYVPDLPYTLSQSCAEPWRMAPCINKIVQTARKETGDVKSVPELYLIRFEETNITHAEVSNSKAPLKDRIAQISLADSLSGIVGSNTHMAIFANNKAVTNWNNADRGNFIEAQRNQLICDLVKTYNNY